MRAQIVTFLGTWQAESKAKERAKDEAKKTKALAQDLHSVLREIGVDIHSSYEDMREKLMDKEAFLAIETEEERKRIFEVSFVI